ncbi:SRPBCC family protein [Maricaulis parjimensis]|uniref:SRPBCC family protein n=1 Tax=Maricaulis parjimensis TaxID=144023 RepID=UPI001939BBAB|nr:SRPBCC domain-containing protein [Maricaulis parjimensis]
MLAFIASFLLVSLQEAQPLEPFEVQGFNASITVEIDAPRETVFDAATGDVTGWWDHSFWPDPAEMVIEPEIGGRFYERFQDGSDNGTLHARVIFVRAPEQLRLHGPLGLSGRAVDLVSSWTLSEGDTPDTTVFRIDLAMMGDVDAELAGVVRQVWVHFIEGRLKPYVEAGCHERPDMPCSAFAE